MAIAPGFNLTVDSSTGRVAFTGKRGSDVFEIASARGEDRAACPEYTVAVSEASAKHALIRRTRTVRGSGPFFKANTKRVQV